MNQVSYLVNSKTNTVEAELIHDQKVTIESDWILKHVLVNKGIYLNDKFKKENTSLLDKKVSRLLPPNENDPKREALFAKAFIECLFEDSLQQMGYYWKKTSEGS